MSLFTELKRRNVFRVGIAYVIVAWLIAQVTELALASFAAPPWVIKTVLYLLVIGFPLALIFAWAFELTPAGIRLEKNVVRSESIVSQTGRKFDLAIIAMLSLALVYFIWESRFAVPTIGVDSVVPGETVDAVDRPRSISIAVLPFVNMSSDPEQEYFSDGITEEILNALAGIRELAVTSRTSAFAFKGKSISIPKIAQELGVDHVLEGSVRKSGNRLRITAQLIEVASDKHIWSQTYDRDLTDIFALQDEISANIAAALKVNLLGHAAANSGTGAVIPEAYDLYLRGLEQIAVSTYGSVTNATDYFEESIAIDSSFVRAYAGLGWAFYGQTAQGSVDIEENLPKIRQVLHRGLELDPDNAGLIGLSGQVAFWEGDLQQAQLLFDRALELDPPHYEVGYAYANLLFRQGYLVEAAQVNTNWLEADPLNPTASIQFIYFSQRSGHFDDVFAATSRLKASAPKNPYGRFLEGLTRILYLGDLAAGIVDFEASVKIDPNDHEGTSMLALTYFSFGETALAQTWVEKGKKMSPDATFVHATEAYGAALRGDLATAREISLQALADHRQFDRWWGGFIILRFAVDELLDREEPMRAVNMILEAEPDWAAFRNQSPVEAPHLSANPGIYGITAFFRDYLPDFVRALRAAGDETGAENVLAHMEASLKWHREYELVMPDTRVAEIHALRGRWDEALDALERAEKSGSIYLIWHYHLIHNRIFDDIRDRPRFEALVQRVSAEMQRQRIVYNNQRSPGVVGSE